MAAVTAEQPHHVDRREIESVVIRFAGDSGDGVQITGSQFTDTTALAGNDLATFPDFPAEIRAPAGTTFGVSAFQINFGARSIATAGDAPDVLVAFNPAALKVSLPDIYPGGLVVLDTGTFSARNLEKAGYTSNPLEDGTLKKYRALKIDISKLTLEAVKDMGLTSKEGLRCKNFWTLGLVYWLYGRSRKSTIEWLQRRFANRPEIANANIAALNAGHAFAETAEMPGEISAYVVPPAPLDPGIYRNITGTDAMAWGLLAGTQLAGVKAVFCSYPITPASSLLHALANLKHYDVVTFQAEDEIAAACSAIGASYGGALGITSSSGPGVALKGEAIGLAISTELPLIIVNAQRGGPVDRHADQDRAIRPVSGYFRPQCRQPGRRPGRPLALRLLRGRDRGGAHRDQVHDAGDRPDRRLYRQRGGAVAHPGYGGLRAFPGDLPDRSGGIPSLRAQSRNPGAALGQAGDARTDASHRRHREILRVGPHLL